jgi:hypothetical protein
MADYTLKLKSVCSGGEHITCDVYRDGVKIDTRMIPKSQIVDPQLSIDQIVDPQLSIDEKIAVLMWWECKKAGATTPAQRKAAIEAAVWSL